MRRLLRKQFRVEYNLNADDGTTWQFFKEYRTMAGAHAASVYWFNRSARGAICMITRIGDRQ